VISDDKQYLIRDRLGPLLGERGLTSFEDLCRCLQAGLDDRFLETVVDAVTTRETSFFRDPHVFQALAAELLPRLVAEASPPGRPIRIWSAGTANGQEAYSLAMATQEFAQAASIDPARQPVFSILASDISAAALRVAQAGDYEARDLARGISGPRTARFFQLQNKTYSIKPAVRKLVEFRQVNLCKPFTGLGTFDLICCRNVLIYFDVATRQQICQRFHGALRDGGWLLLGTAENLYGIATNFESLKFGDALVYRKLPGANRAV
jgi:chemotaxis protein methyltransferase CheR